MESPGDTEEGKRHHPTGKQQGRQRGTNTHSALILSLHASSVSLFILHRDTEQDGLESTTANTSAGHRDQRKQQQDWA